VVRLGIRARRKVQLTLLFFGGYSQDDRRAAPSASSGSVGDRLRLEVVWKQPLGSGYSGVAVADGQVVTMLSDGKHDVVAAFNAADGRERWRYDGSGPESWRSRTDDVLEALFPLKPNN